MINSNLTSSLNQYFRLDSLQQVVASETVSQIAKIAGVALLAIAAVAAIAASLYYLTRSKKPTPKPTPVPPPVIPPKVNPIKIPVEPPTMKAEKQISAPIASHFQTDEELAMQLGMEEERAFLEQEKPKAKIVPKTFAAKTVAPKTVQVSQPITKHADTSLAFGPQAFVAPKLTDRDTYPTFTKEEILTILDGYKDKNGLKMFEKVNPRLKAPEGIVKNLIVSTYFNGLPNYPYLKDETTKYLALIIDLLRPDSPFTKAKKMAIAERVSDAFANCQADQLSTLEALGKELLSKGNLLESVRCYWQAYKTAKLEELVTERDPNRSVVAATSQTQFPHLKNGYLALLGDQFGLDGTDAAKKDTLRALNILKPGENAQALAAIYQKRLDLKEFIKELALDINSSNEEVSRIDKARVFEWGKCNGKPTFSYFDDIKDYSGCGEITEKQKVFFKPCMTLAEARYILSIAGVCYPEKPEEIVKRDLPRGVYGEALKNKGVDAALKEAMTQQDLIDYFDEIHFSRKFNHNEMEKDVWIETNKLVCINDLKANGKWEAMLYHVEAEDEFMLFDEQTFGTFMEKFYEYIKKNEELYTKKKE